jgi:dihydrofolate synthase/folylpolyglutamate synthase
MAYLDGLTGYESTGVIAEPGTGRVERITAALGSPNRRYPAVHITGTNGKGSTSALITRLLRGQGLRVGTYTSPHLRQVTERVAIDEQPVTEAQFAAGLGKVAWACRRAGVTPSWFEAVTAAGFVLFADARVDVAVVEVGMLGRWDATNVVDSSVAVVTNVELDHADIAGPTRMHIAAEKAGIVRSNTTLVLGDIDTALLPVFLAQRPHRILRMGSDISVSGRRPTPTGSTVDLRTPYGSHANVPITLLGEHQCSNAALALAATEAFLGAQVDTESVRRAFDGVQLGGRAEILCDAGPCVLLDAAHNRAAAAQLRTTLDEYFGRARPRVLVCAVSGMRDPAEFLHGIGAHDFDLVVATEPEAARMTSAESVVAAARRLTPAAISVPDPALALRHAMSAAGEDGLVVVTGSLYLLEPVRRAFAASAGAIVRAGSSRP